jgi:hypothetical protein
VRTFALLRRRCAIPMPTLLEAEVMTTVSSPSPALPCPARDEVADVERRGVDGPEQGAPVVAVVRGTGRLNVWYQGCAKCRPGVVSRNPRAAGSGIPEVHRRDAAPRA